MATMTNVKDLREKFMEVRDKFPYMQMLGKREETMHGEILTWCRDYFGSPKDELLAYMIAGYWQNKIECEHRNRKNYDEMYDDMWRDLKAMSYSDHAWEVTDEEMFHFEEPFDISLGTVTSIYYDRGNETVRVCRENFEYTWSELLEQDKIEVVNHFEMENY